MERQCLDVKRLETSNHKAPSVLLLVAFQALLIWLQMHSHNIIFFYFCNIILWFSFKLLMLMVSCYATSEWVIASYTIYPLRLSGCN